MTDIVSTSPEGDTLDAIRAALAEFQSQPTTGRAVALAEAMPIVLVALEEVRTDYAGFKADFIALANDKSAAEARGQRLRAALTFMPDVEFPNLPGLTAPDILIAIAAWMDKVDDTTGATNHDVQEHLRRWAAVMMDALAQVGSEGTDG